MKFDFDKVGVNLIPAGTVVPLRAWILRGNVPPDNVLTRSQKGDCSGLKVEYTVTSGEHAGRKFQLWHTVEGTTPGHAEACAHTMATFRAIVDAVYSLDPRDTSPEAASLRTDIDLTFFDGVVFLAEVGIETGRPKPRGSGNFPDRNVIDRILRIGDAEYQEADPGEGYDPDADREAEIAFYGKEVVEEVLKKRESVSAEQQCD